MFLQADGHRVRLATHANFKEFVLTAGLEFFPLGGDPKVLAACEFLIKTVIFPFYSTIVIILPVIFNADMVKNKGFLPSGPSEIYIQRNQIRDIIFSLHPACVDPDPDTNIPFKLDAIIANPPAYGKTYIVLCQISFTGPLT